MKAGIKATIRDMEAYLGELDPHVESYMAEDRLHAVREDVKARLNLGPDSEGYPFLSLVDGDLEKALEDLQERLAFGFVRAALLAETMLY